MPRHTLRIPAKLSPPRLARTLPRERLFACLDQRLACGALWISGPPGAGKTTLVASYCQARSLKVLWYRLDADDNDAGQFFAHLTQAAAQLGAARGLPPFAPEHLSRPQVYARSFFRAAFAALPLHAALALYQGRFLAEDDNEAWSISAREHLRSKFNRLVGSYGAALLRAGRTEEALACYKRGIEADDLAEEFYQGVMRCAVTLDRPAEGLQAFLRLQRMLSLLLGVAPSAQTETLRRQLQGG